MCSVPGLSWAMGTEKGSIPSPSGVPGLVGASTDGTPRPGLALSAGYTLSTPLLFSSRLWLTGAWFPLLEHYSPLVCGQLRFLHALSSCKYLSFSPQSQALPTSPSKSAVPSTGSKRFLYSILTARITLWCNSFLNLPIFPM